jgi:DNA-directed RNA polymerase I subunit RPA1
MSSIIEGGEGLGVQLEGVNFNAVWELSEDLIDFNQLSSNDIYEILNRYGVEAARVSITQQVVGIRSSITCS